MIGKQMCLGGTDEIASSGTVLACLGTSWDLHSLLGNPISESNELVGIEKRRFVTSGAGDGNTWWAVSDSQLLASISI
jgi:hypothetical protein